MTRKIIKILLHLYENKENQHRSSACNIYMTCNFYEKVAYLQVAAKNFIDFKSVQYKKNMSNILKIEI